MSDIDIEIETEDESFTELVDEFRVECKIMNILNRRKGSIVLIKLFRIVDSRGWMNSKEFAICYGESGPEPCFLYVLNERGGSVYNENGESRFVYPHCCTLGQKSYIQEVEIKI